VINQRSAQCFKRSRRRKPAKELVHCRGRKAFGSKLIAKNDLGSLEKNSGMFLCETMVREEIYEPYDDRDHRQILEPTN